MWNTRFAIFFLLFLLVYSCKRDETSVPHELLLHAERFNDPGIYDRDGRFMLMRGVNYNVLGDYWHANPDVPATAPYDPDQFRIMAEYGFNVVRLIINWSAVEPERGLYDYGYIEKIKTAIEDAASYGIYTLIDMHQDAYSRFVFSTPGDNCESPAKGWDGAPEWAYLPEGASTCTEGGSRESAPAVAAAFRNLWNNTNGIQDALINAWAEVVRETSGYPTVLGYDAFNEPSLGDADLGAQTLKYSAFLKKLVRAVRQAESESGGYKHIFFFENTVTWNNQEVPAVPSFDFTTDRNIVFAPHNYFEIIVQGILTIEQGAALFDLLADGFGTHCFIGEWGVFGNSADNMDKLRRLTDAEDEYFMGSTWWQWCQAPGDPHGISWDGASYAPLSMHLTEVSADGSYTGNLNEQFLKVLGRARPVAIHGKPGLFESDPESGYMYLSAKASGKGLTELWIPDYFGEPLISGSNAELQRLEQVSGGYRAFVEVNGDYTITVGD